MTVLKSSSLVWCVPYNENYMNTKVEKQTNHHYISMTLWQFFSKAHCCEFPAMRMIENNWHIIKEMQVVKKSSRTHQCVPLFHTIQIQSHPWLGSQLSIATSSLPFGLAFHDLFQYDQPNCTLHRQKGEVLDKTDAGNFAALLSRPEILSSWWW